MKKRVPFLAEEKEALEGLAERLFVLLPDELFEYGEVQREQGRGCRIGGLRVGSRREVGDLAYALVAVAGASN